MSTQTNQEPSNAAPANPAVTPQAVYLTFQGMQQPMVPVMRGQTFTWTALATVVAAVAILGSAAYYFAGPKVVKEVVQAPPEVQVIREPAPPPEIRVVERVVEKIVEAPTPEPEKPPPLPVKLTTDDPPPEPPSTWTGLWRDPEGLSTIRLIQSENGLGGFYQPINSKMAPGTLEQGRVVEGEATFFAMLGDFLFGVRMERTGEDTAVVIRWIDPDGLKRTADHITAMARSRQINAQQLAQLRIELQKQMRVAGKKVVLGTFHRDDN